MIKLQTCGDYRKMQNIFAAKYKDKRENVYRASHVPRHFCLFFNNYCEFCKMVEDFSSQFDPIYHYFSFGHSGIGHPV